MQRTIPILCIFFLLVGCDYFKQEGPRVPVARVNNNYLYQEDIADLIGEATSVEDSTLLVNNYINRWATQQLLIDQAKINLSEEELEDYQALVQQYQNELYTEAYKNVIVSRQLDSTIREADMQRFYELNKENFKLNETLLKVRYIHVDVNFSNLNRTRSTLDRFNAEDKVELDSLSIQYKSFNFNDSTWVKQEALMEVIPPLVGQADQVLKKSNFAQLQDSLGLYLVKIEDLLVPNDIAPLSYVKPTIEQVILNKRKLELIKELEKDITKDAIKNKSFEIYIPQ